MAAQTTKPTKETAVKVIELLSHGLVRGVGEPHPGKFCVEAAVCYAMGQPHGDKPACVAPSVRAFKIALNDQQWSSNQARANGLRRIAIAQLGSSEIDEAVFVKELSLAVIRKIVPIALRNAAKIHPIEEHRLALEGAARNCETSAARSAAESAASAAESAARSAAWSAASAARSAASAAWSAAWSAEIDAILGLAAACGVEALIAAKSPGCAWLELAQ